MILIKLGKFAFKCQKDWAFCEKRGDPHYTKIYIGFLHIFLIPERGEFIKYMRMYLNDDYTLHRRVRLAEKKAWSKTRAQVKKYHGQEMERLRQNLEEEYKSRVKAQGELAALKKTIKIVKGEY
ncbi:hypothetical protein [Psychrobacter pygoscelis]|uniref:hypothetical protein n=1 Tax=Psychrobacter pygoscelis TaxID=2488563 RepID=UPI00103AB5B8|nr:hypothetical protein [Psychrobacter pygoscelis]